jgi:tetratricopeptide (TPR) repeat protein
MQEGNAGRQMGEDRPVNRPRRLWVVAVGAVALGLLLWFWQSNRHHAPQTPAEIEQQATDNPDDFHTQLLWGEILVQAKQYDDAAPILAHARELSPNDARPYAWLGVIAIAVHRSEDARKQLNQALKLDSSNVTAIRALANLDAQEHHLRPAMQGFERLTQLLPKDADAWQRLGMVLMGVGENYRSLDALTRAATLDPNDLLTQTALGNMSLQAGRLDQAEHAFEVVLAKRPDNPQAHMGMALVIMRRDPSTDGLKKAEEQAEAALRTVPSPAAYSTRAQVRMTMHRFEDAIPDLNAAINLEPDNRNLYVLLSQCYASAGKPELARRASAEFERRRTAVLARDRAARHTPEDKK